VALDLRTATSAFVSGPTGDGLACMTRSRSDFATTGSTGRRRSGLTQDEARAARIRAIPKDDVSEQPQRHHLNGESGVFVAFEETAEDLIQNVRSLGYDLDDLIERKLLVIESSASPRRRLTRSSAARPGS